MHIPWFSCCSCRSAGRASHTGAFIRRFVFVGLGLTGIGTASAQYPTSAVVYDPVTKIIQGNQPLIAQDEPSPTAPVNPYYLTIKSPAQGVTFPYTVTLSFSILGKPSGVSHSGALSFVSASPATLVFTAPNQPLQTKIAVNVPLGSYAGDYKWELKGNWPANITDLGAQINATVFPPIANPNVPPDVRIDSPVDGAIYVYDGVNPVKFQINYSADVGTGGLPLTALLLLFDDTPLLPFVAPVLGGTSASASAWSPELRDGGVHIVRAIAQNDSGGDEVLIKINVHAPPKILTHPASQSVYVGDAVQFSVVASGTPAPTYQWQKGGVDIPGATASTYSIPSAALSDAGNDASGYRVVVSNYIGNPGVLRQATSNNARLSVRKRPQTIGFPALGTKYYGAAPFAAGATATSGLSVGYTSSNSNVASVSGSTVTVHSIGTTTITASQPGDDVYDPATPVAAMLAVEKAPLTVTAVDAVRTYGTPNPEFVVSYSGFVNGESAADLTAAPTASTGATISSNAGPYAIVPAGGVSPNYAFIYVNGTLTIAKASQTISFGALPEKTVGDPAFMLAATATSTLPVSYVSSNSAVATIAGSVVTIVGSGSTVITASQAGDLNYNAAQPVTQTLTVRSGSTPDPCGIAVVRHALDLNGKAGVNGSVQVLLGENITLNGNDWISKDLLVVGTPSIRTNGHPLFGGVFDGTGSASPSNYVITLDGNPVVGRILRQTNPVSMPEIGPLPTPGGSRDVRLNSARDTAGNFATIRDLTVGGDYGQVAVPPGTYRDLTANGGNGFTLGTIGATQPSIYHVRNLRIMGNGELRIVGPVILTVADECVLNGTAGDAGHPEWLALNLHSGDLTLDGNVVLYGHVLAPFGEVRLNGFSKLCGGLKSDRLRMNGNAVLELCGCAATR